MPAQVLAPGEVPLPESAGSGPLARPRAAPTQRDIPAPAARPGVRDLGDISSPSALDSQMVPRLGCQAGPSWDQSLSLIPIPGSSPCPWILGKRDFQGQTWLKSSGLCRDLLKGGVCPGPSSLPVLSQGPPAPQPRGDSCSTRWFYRALAPLSSQATLIQWFAPQGGSGLLRGEHGSPQARRRRDDGQ